MPTIRTQSHMHFGLEAMKIKREPKVLQLSTETETIGRALDSFFSEYQRDGLVADGDECFVKSGIAVKDVYGTLAP